jgi:Mn-dependent DtxR family transcriptional regulator
MLHDRVKNNQLMLTQENAALLLGANRSTITIAAQTLRNKGLIDYTRGKFYLLDRQGLETSACECYSVFQTNF